MLGIIKSSHQILLLLVKTAASVTLPQFIPWQIFKKKKRCTMFLLSYRNMGGILGEQECCGIKHINKRVFPMLFQVLSNFHKCLNNSIETQGTFFYYFEKILQWKKKLVYFDLQYLNFLCLCHEYVNGLCNSFVSI